MSVVFFDANKDSHYDFMTELPLPSSLFRTTRLYQCLKTQMMKPGCASCYRKDYLSLSTTPEFEDLWPQLFYQVFCTFGALRPPEARVKLKASFVVPSMISSANFPAGLATREAFPVPIWGTIRCVYGGCSFPGHHDNSLEHVISWHIFQQMVLPQT